MGCLILQAKFLQLFEGKVANIDYEFACEHKDQIKQNNVSYLIVDLNSLSNDHSNNQQQENLSQANIIAGIIYCNEDFKSEKIRVYALSMLRNNIFIKQKDYLEGFRNVINALKDYSDSYESGNSSNQQKTLINFLMKIEDNVYLSSSVEASTIKELNDWKIMLENQKTYRKVDINKDLLQKCNEFYQVKQKISGKIKEIILTSDYCPTKHMYSNFRNVYPILQTFRDSLDMYLLKLKMPPREDQSLEDKACKLY